MKKAGRFPGLFLLVIPATSRSSPRIVRIRIASPSGISRVMPGNVHHVVRSGRARHRGSAAGSLPRSVKERRLIRDVASRYPNVRERGTVSRTPKRRESARKQIGEGAFVVSGRTRARGVGSRRRSIIRVFLARSCRPYAAPRFACRFLNSVVEVFQRLYHLVPIGRGERGSARNGGREIGYVNVCGKGERCRSEGGNRSEREREPFLKLLEQGFVSHRAGH